MFRVLVAHRLEAYVFRGSRIAIFLFDASIANLIIHSQTHLFSYVHLSLLRHTQLHRRHYLISSIDQT